VSGAESAIEADPSRLHQVFDNLIQNAIKFSPRGSHIDVSVRSSPAAVLVTVEDRGTGMDSETVRAVLAGNARSLRGTELETGFGLGLAISRAIVEKHGGSLRVGSAPHKGSRFEIRLPAQ
jgi:signal transduction histidine kinase